MEMKKTLILLVLTVFVASVSLQPAYSISSPNGEVNENGEKAERLLKILERAQLQVNDTLNRVKLQGVSIPEEAQNSFEEGCRLAQTAFDLYEDGDYEGASETAIEAMGMFKEAMRLVGNVQLTEEELEAQSAVGLSVARSRAEIFINCVEQLASRAEELGYNVSGIQESLAEARARLENATTLAGVGNIEGVEVEVRAAVSIAAKNMGELRQIVKSDKPRLIELFIHKALGRLEDTENETLPLTTSTEVAKRIKGALEKARSHLNEARNLVKKGQMGMAIDEVMETIRVERRAVAKSTGTVDFLDEHGKVWALVVGISDYTPQGPGGPDLEYADDDADVFNKTLTEVYNVTSSQITVLKDNAATRTAVESWLNTLPSGAEDDVIIFISSHGTRMTGDPDGDGEEVDNGIVTHDLQYIWDGDLENLLSTIHARRIVVILDVSFPSGFADDLGELENVLVMMTGEVDRGEAKELEAYEHGVLTYWFVVQGMLEGKADVRWENPMAPGTDDGLVPFEEAYDYAFCHMQTPQMQTRIPMIGKPMIVDNLANDMLPMKQVSPTETVTSVEDAIRLLQDLRSEIDTLPSEAFKKPKHEESKKDILLRKVDAVIEQVESGRYQRALTKLNREVRKLIEVWMVDPWKSELNGKIDEVARNLQPLVKLQWVATGSGRLVEPEGRGRLVIGAFKLGARVRGLGWFSTHTSNGERMSGWLTVENGTRTQGLVELTGKARMNDGSRLVFNATLEEIGEDEPGDRDDVLTLVIEGSEFYVFTGNVRVSDGQYPVILPLQNLGEEAQLSSED